MSTGIKEFPNQNRYIGLAKHCIGLDRKKPYTRHSRKFYRPYRNYYYVKEDNEEWSVLENAGYASHLTANRPGYVSFYLTREGLDWLGEQLGIYIYDEEN